MATTPGAQNFGAVLFERNSAANSGDLGAHHVGGTQAGQCFANSRLRDALLRGVQEKEADENAPESWHDQASEDTETAQKDHGVGDQTSSAACNASGARKILGCAPNNSAKDSAAVERKSGEKIENGQHGICFPKPVSERGHRLVRRKEQT